MSNPNPVDPERLQRFRLLYEKSERVILFDVERRHAKWVRKGRLLALILFALIAFVLYVVSKMACATFLVGPARDDIILAASISGSLVVTSIFMLIRWNVDVPDHVLQMQHYREAEAGARKQFGFCERYMAN